MTEVKDVMNDVYLTYKKYKKDGNMREWNERMAELAKKYQGDNFFCNLAITFTSRISEELGI